MTVWFLRYWSGDIPSVHVCRGRVCACVLREVVCMYVKGSCV